MKVLISLLTIYLMTGVGGCEPPAEFMNDSRVVVEGKVFDISQKPVSNKIIYYSNKIQTSETKTKSDGSFYFSLPRTNKNTTLQIGEKIISFEASKSNSSRIIYPNTLVIENPTTYLNVKLIIE